MTRISASRTPLVSWRRIVPRKRRPGIDRRRPEADRLRSPPPPLTGRRTSDSSWHIACPSRERNARLDTAHDCAANDRRAPGSVRCAVALGLRGAVAARRRTDDDDDLRGVARLAAARARRRRRGAVAPASRPLHAREGPGPVLGRPGVLVLVAGAGLLPAHHEHRRAPAQVDGVRVFLGGTGRGWRLRARLSATLPASRAGRPRRPRAGLSAGDALSDGRGRSLVRVYACG